MRRPALVLSDRDGPHDTLPAAATALEDAAAAGRPRAALTRSGMRSDAAGPRLGTTEEEATR